MKKYQKALGIITVIAAIPLMAAENDTIIKVNTFVDEDLDNNLCSLKEAIIAAERSTSYHGCILPAINTKYVIQLEKGTYNLDEELIPKNNLTIQGPEPIDWSKKGLLSGSYPAPTAIQTRINAGGKSRIFNTAVSKQPLALNNIILENGKASDVGGAIYAGADVALQNTQILNSQAAQGGAIYLGGGVAGLSIFHSLIQGNGTNASRGSVVAMSCMFNGSYAIRTISFDSNTIIKNGSTASLSAFEFCGTPTIKFNNNTITQNIASPTNGTVLKFSGDAVPTQNQTTNLSSTSSLTLINNTIVENSAHTIFLYDKLGKKDLSFNVLAFNSGSFACRYLLGSATDQKDARILLKFNALKLSGSNEKCDMPTETLPAGHTNIDVSSKILSQLLEPSKEPSDETTDFLPIYYPKNNQQSDDLVDVDLKNEGGCLSLDQRGLERLTSTSTGEQTVLNSDNKCDIGSVEQARLAVKTTAVDTGYINSSLTDLLNTYQSGVDQTKANLANPAFSLQEPALKMNLANFENLVNQTKANLKYRGIYINLKNYYSTFKNGNPREINIIPYENSNHVFVPFKPDDYDIDVKVIGKGQTPETAKEDNIKSLKCEWNSSLQQILLYRTDDAPSGDDFEFCQYTLTLKANRSITATGIVKASFINIAPVSGNGTITFKYLANEIIPLNLLKYANDDGDGPTNTLITKPTKPQFADLPIYLPSKVSEDGIFTVVKADREGPCPGNDSKNTCYGGNVYIQAKNVFNTFNDRLTYYVYDADGEKSNEGTINLVSTATTTDDTRSGGGGSLGILSLASLLGLAAYRRYRK
ncbi:CSLREA domain-containing protein [Acinetobacter pittii]|uniref:CSLREA domain-containing protein n=1 Tax=Acinetobacter pittii TaxID=48296 RepID=A0A6H0FRP2_ACIPI|nr:CSLREA domain-containing protein [Acinetobacter pittii]QIT17023.1 CSLREA domain-containing protein [Acinetobacter pittii]